MTDDRDPMMGRRLDDLPTPDHRPDFWADLRLDLDQDPNATPESPEVEPRSVEDEEPLSLDAARVRRDGRSVRALVAAAVLLLALVAAGVVLIRDDTDRSVDLAADRVEDATIAAAPTGPLGPGEEVRSGSGTPVAVDPSGRFLYVVDDAPGDGLGCEGGDNLTLYVEPIEGGARRPAVAGVEVGGAGRTDLVFGPDGDVVVITSCEGFTSRVVVGTVGDDGTIEDASVLDPTASDQPGGPNGGRNLVDVAWQAPGVLVASTLDYTDTGQERHLITFPPEPSASVSDLGPSGVIWLVPIDGDTLATVSDDGTVRAGDRVLGATTESFGIEAGPDRSLLAVYGGSGLILFDVGSGTSRTVTADVVTSVHFTTAGDLLYRTIGPDDVTEVRALPPGASDGSGVVLARAGIVAAPP